MLTSYFVPLRLKMSSSLKETCDMESVHDFLLPCNKCEIFTTLRDISETKSEEIPPIQRQETLYFPPSDMKKDVTC